jgi:predicted dehydrogenase/threonine dehydrogenase-like Zn-dependent dehydrogenase
MAETGILQVIQFQKTGKISIERLPSPPLRNGGILVRNEFSLISAGTERTSVETAQASMIGKARSRPDLVKQVLDNARSEGMVATYRKVQNRLANFKELGYSSAGTVIASDVDAFRVGDRVACAGYAYHAEVVSIPRNLAVRLPDNVSTDEAAFATLGAIALQGVRRAEIHLGETVVVIGLGLIGLITVQLLKAAGCRVAALDISKANFALAKELGCDVCMSSDRDAVRKIEGFTHGHGSDATILTAATRSNEPLELALQFARKKSPIVVVGAGGMNVVRGPFYDKELDLRIATSYGPGRYDPAYEEQGHDYPIGYVRWTENRNMEAFIDLLASRAITLAPLITHKIPVRNALKAYDMITGKLKTRYVGILIEYDRTGVAGGRRVEIAPSSHGRPASTETGVGFIGAGNFAQSYLLPPLTTLHVPLRGVVTSTPVNANAVAHKFGFAYCASDADEILKDPAVNAVFVASRHDSHAAYVVKALRAGKNVFVEKPLAINREQILTLQKELGNLHGKPRPHLTVGFNRRYSQPFTDIKGFFEGTQEPLSILYRVNAGFMPLSKWMQDPTQGGRFIGEACHFIDCMSYLTNAQPVRVYAERVPSKNQATETSDNISASIKFSDGSVGTLLYLALGEGTLPKEYCEVSGGGKSAVMNDFSDSFFYANGKRQRHSYDHGKGHNEEVAHFMKVVQGQEQPLLSVDSMVQTTLATIAAIESLRTGAPVPL